MNLQKRLEFKRLLKKHLSLVFCRHELSLHRTFHNDKTTSWHLTWFLLKIFRLLQSFNRKKILSETIKCHVDRFVERWGFSWISSYFETQVGVTGSTWTQPLCKYHGDLESGSARAQHVPQRYPAVLQDDVSSGRRFDAQLVFLLPQGEPRVRHGDQEGTDTLQTRKTKSRKSKTRKMWARTTEQSTPHFLCSERKASHMRRVVPCVWATCRWWRTRRWQKRPSC